MDRLFEDFFGHPTATSDDGQRQATPTYVLPLDVKEVDGGYEIQAAVPGFKPQEVEVTFSEGVLTIQAQHSEDSSQRQEGYLRREVSHANYRRAIQLPGDVKEQDITANFENGVLTVRVPKAPRPQPKKIQVSGSSQKELSGKSS
jgi:HSP20 family protein